MDDQGWSDYDCNSANQHWAHESRLGPRHRSGPLQNSQQFGQHTEKRAKSLQSQFGQKYDHNSARNTYWARPSFRNAWSLRLVFKAPSGCSLKWILKYIVFLLEIVCRSSANTANGRVGVRNFVTVQGRRL